MATAYTALGQETGANGVHSQETGANGVDGQETGANGKDMMRCLI